MSILGDSLKTLQDFIENKNTSLLMLWLGLTHDSIVEVKLSWISDPCE